MIHYSIGNLGHIFVIASFVFSLFASVFYLRAAQLTDPQSARQWRQNGAFFFCGQVIAVIGIVIALYTIIFNHYFEYNYAYSYTDRKLPWFYLVSTFWNGQEGSFLLWMFWNALLGVVLIRFAGRWEARVMMVFSFIQVFLTSMILGIVIPGLDIKIGSSPFILLRDAVQDPAFAANPEFIPEDGNGLNPLLQNYWMVIHPPTLFLGFASTAVPFAFCIAGLLQRKYREWVRPALPWAIFSGAVLGLGILMGGYWAYETLNFGGYWNWDPVENAVYVPWLVLIGAIHLMIAYKNNETALKGSMITVVVVFLLILYSTFLTRSGVLGDASVHSFTDLGLSGQLLIYMFFFLIGSVVLLAIRWKEIPLSSTESSVYSREFWIFIGVTVLMLMGFQVLLPTSIPVWNRIVEFFGGESNLAPPADQIGFYTKFQFWFGVLIAVLSGMGQFFWWKRIDAKRLRRELFYPLIITGLLFVILLETIVSAEGGIQSVKYVFLFLAGLFTIVANGKILISLMRSSPSLSGGSVAHIGVGLMLIGILFSAGYSRVVSLNNTGLLIRSDLDDEFNRESLLLFLHEPRTMAGYEIEFMGERFEPRNKSGYLTSKDFYNTPDPDRVIAARDVIYNGRLLYSEGDTFNIARENTYYEIEFRKDGIPKYTLYPRAQINRDMNGIVASPDIVRGITRDIYTHVNMLVPRSDDDWSEVQEIRVRPDSVFYVNDYIASIEDVVRIFSVQGQPVDSADVAVKAIINVQGEREVYQVEPIFLIHDNMVARLPDEINDLGIRIALFNIHPEDGEFSFGVQSRQKDMVVIKALEKPYINILWLGTGVLMIGFGIAMVRRVREYTKMKAKGLD